MLKVTTSIVIMWFMVQGNLPQFTLPVLVGMLMGLSIRLTFNVSNNTLTFKNSILRLINAIVICYLILIIWDDYKISKNPVYAAFITGFLSMEIVNEIAKILNIGLRAYGRKWINFLLAKDDSNRENTID